MTSTDIADGNDVDVHRWQNDDDDDDGDDEDNSDDDGEDDVDDGDDDFRGGVSATSRDLWAELCVC